MTGMILNDRYVLYIVFEGDFYKKVVKDNLPLANCLFFEFIFTCIIDDEPDDEGSPHHYVLIHGILTASVIYHLIEAGVNVDAIICVKAQNYDRLTPAADQQDESTAAKVS